MKIVWGIVFVLVSMLGLFFSFRFSASDAEKDSFVFFFIEVPSWILFFIGIVMVNWGTMGLFV